RGRAASLDPRFTAGRRTRSRSSRSEGWPGAARTSARAGPGPAAGRRRRRAPGRRGGLLAPARPEIRAREARPRPLRPEDRGCPPSAGRGRSPSPEDDLRVGQVLVEPDPCDALERLDIAPAGAGDDVLGELWAGVGLVPAERFAVVANELLVERGLRPSRLVLVGGPEPRRVGRERLVGENEYTALVEPELEFRVRDDD